MPHSFAPFANAWERLVTTVMAKSSAKEDALSAFLAWRSSVPWSGWFCLFAVFWALGTLAINWTSRTGDYSKARRALSHS